MVETGSTVFYVLFLVALVLLVIVSGGIIYLTAVEWRDRRLQDKEKRKK
jgi:Na+-transporting NADH:ubiquinone oxidoreductase subunit NqrC